MSCIIMHMHTCTRYMTLIDHLYSSHRQTLADKVVAGVPFLGEALKIHQELLAAAVG